VYAGNLVYALLINEGQSLYMMKMSNLGFYWQKLWPMHMHRAHQIW